MAELDPCDSIFRALTIVLNVGLLILSAFFHALWNTMLKRSRDPRTASICVLIVAAISSTFWSVVMREPFWVGTEAFGWTVAAGVFEGAYFFALGVALQRSPLSLVYLVTRGGAMIEVWIISIVFMIERPNVYALCGVALVLVGLAVVHARPGLRWVDRGATWAYGCSFCIAGYHLSYGRALDLNASPVALFATSLWFGTALYIAIGQRKILREIRAAFALESRLLISAGIVCTVSFAVFLIGLKHLGPGLAITLRNTSILFAQGFSLYLGEKLGTSW